MKGLLLGMFAASLCIWGLYKVVLKYGWLGLFTALFVLGSVVSLYFFLMWSYKYEVKGL